MLHILAVPMETMLIKINVATIHPAERARILHCSQECRMMDYAVEARRHREMAEECRTMAACLTDKAVCGAYRRLAEDYDKLAENEERIARNLKLAD